MRNLKLILLITITVLTKNVLAQLNVSDTIKVYHSIGEGLTEPDEVRTLELINVKDLDSLNMLSQFKNLESLSLIDFHSEVAPASIANLKNLKVLKFINDDFSTVPNSYKNLTSLERLDFIYDTHLDIENTLEIASALPALIELRIEGLPGYKFPEQAQFPKQLKILSLRNNHLNTLPTGVGQLTQLEILDLGNNDFIQLPVFLTSLKGLNEIYLDQQPFLRFDYTFNLLSQIPSLQSVHMEGNHLNRATADAFLKESLFHVFLDEEHAELSKLYAPNINLNLPPTPPNHSGKITILKIKN